MQPQSTKNIYNGPSKGVKNSTQSRTNQTAGANANRQQNFSNNTPRNRYMQPTAIFPPLQPGIVMGQFNAAAYAARPANLQQCQYAAQFYPQMYYPYYVPHLPQQQQQQQQQPLTQQTGGGGSLMGVVTIQPGSFVSGATANQTVIPFAVTPTNSLLNVAHTAASQTVGLTPLQQAQAQLSYGLGTVPNTSVLSVASTTATVPSVSAPPTRMTFAAAALAGNTGRMGPPQAVTALPATKPQIKAKLRSHALQIIHPITNKNILQDLNNDKELALPAITTTSQTQITESKVIRSSKSSEIVQSKDLTMNQGCVKKYSSVSLKRNYKDAAQQAEQASIATVKTHDACVEIIPNMADVLKRKIDETITITDSKSQQLQEEIKRENVTLLQDFKEKDNEKCKKSEERESKILAEFELGIRRSSEDFKDRQQSNDHISSTIKYEQMLQSEGSVGKEYLKEEYDDTKSSTDASSVIEELDAYNLLTVISEIANPTTVKGQLELEEALLNNNEDKETPTGPRDRKQYTRRQLMQLRQAKQSCVQPEVKNCSIFAPVNLMPAFVARVHKNVNSMAPHTSREGCSGSLHSQNNYLKQNNKANRSNNNAVVGGAAGASDQHHHHNRNKGKPLIYLNLSINQEVKLNEADNAWKPKVLTDVADENLQPEKDNLIRHVRGILNKLTPENFEPLVEQIIKLKVDTLDKMEAVMNLVFEKAIDEPNFSVSYAKLCHRLIAEVKASDERMASATKTNLAYFRNALLDKTEREFTHHVIKINAKEEKLKPIREKYDQCQDTNEKIELEALLHEEERKIRRRSGGTVRFIGELFKISILSGKIIHSCIEALLKVPNNEDMLECLCKLLTTVGQKFEQTCVSQEDKRKYSLKTVIQRMQNIASKSENSKISSRVRFMLQDVIDLRKKKWQSTRNNEAPKTMEQIEKEVNKTNQSGAANTESVTNALQESRKLLKPEQNALRKRLESGLGQRDGKRMDLSATNKDSKWHVQTNKLNPTHAVDTSKLVGLTNVDMNNKKMGGASLFQWKKMTTQPATSNTNSFAALSSMEANKTSTFHNTERERQRSGGQTKSLNSKAGQDRENAKANTNPLSRSSQRNVRVQKANNPNKYQQEMTANISEEPSSSMMQPVLKEPNHSELKIIKSVVNEMLENAYNSKNINGDTVACLKRLPDSLKSPLINYLLTDYLHLANVKSLSRRHLANITAYLIETEYLTVEHFHVAYRNFAELASDLIVDVPELWLYIFEFTGPLMVKNLITINDLWNKQLKESGPPAFSKKFLKSLILYSTREVGPNFTRNMWQKHRIKWSDFMPETEMATFIASNQFEFIENPHKPFNIIGNLKESPETLQKRVIGHIQQLLKEAYHSDLIIDYINGNIAQVTRNFINNLTTTLISYALKDHNNYGLDLGKFQKVCLPILRRYLDSKEDLELECLHALYQLIQNLEHPKGLWETICAELNDADIMAQETFIAWHNSKDQEE